VRTEKTKDIHLARIEVRDMRLAGHGCVGDKRGRSIMFVSAWAALRKNAVTM